MSSTYRICFRHIALNIWARLRHVRHMPIFRPISFFFACGVPISICLKRLRRDVKARAYLMDGVPVFGISGQDVPFSGYFPDIIEVGYWYVYMILYRTYNYPITYQVPGTSINICRCQIYMNIYIIRTHHE